MKKKYIWLILIGIFLIYQFALLPAIEQNQTIFPMKLNEIARIDVRMVGNEREVIYLGLNDEQKRTFVDTMNHIVLQSGEQAKGSVAYACHYESKDSNPQNAPVIATVKISYKKSLMQRKTGVILYFYEDNSFMLDEVKRLHRIPFRTNRVSASPTVYEHGREAFIDGSDQQEAVKELILLLEDYKLWFAEQQ